MRFGGIVLVVLLGLTACSSEPVPREPEASASSATPPATLPSMPAQAKKDSPEGAAAFVKHYIDVVNLAANSGRTKPMLSLSHECAPCDSFAMAFSDEPTGDQRFTGKLWSLKRIVASSDRAPLIVRAELAVREGRESNPYAFAFILSESPPYKIQDIRMADKS
ncbi:DUF6318 family protein [Aeromicrobium sp.]|uniref:DUF6318 family protein n=1 Tax=Aeromicrobium sp. TaxID=1871063 RepID=UPI003C63FAF6